MKSFTEYLSESIITRELARSKIKGTSYEAVYTLNPSWKKDQSQDRFAIVVVEPNGTEHIAATAPSSASAKGSFDKIVKGDAKLLKMLGFYESAEQVEEEQDGGGYKVTLTKGKEIYSEKDISKAELKKFVQQSKKLGWNVDAITSPDGKVVDPNKLVKEEQQQINEGWDQFIKNVATRTDNNDHTIARLMIAKKMRHKKLENAYQSLNEIDKDWNQIASNEIVSLRNKLERPLKYEIDRFFSKEEAAAVHGAL